MKGKLPVAVFLAMLYIVGVISCRSYSDPREDDEYRAEYQITFQEHGRKLIQAHHQVKARCLEKVTVIHTPISIIRYTVSFIDYSKPKQRIKTLQHSRPPDRGKIWQYI